MSHGPRNIWENILKVNKMKKITNILADVNKISIHILACMYAHIIKTSVKQNWIILKENEYNKLLDSQRKKRKIN